MHYFIENFQEIIKDTPLMLVTGFFTLILGVLMVVSHNIWQWNWRVLITIIGWIILLNGVSTIFYPQYIDQATILLAQNQHIIYSSSVLNFIMGIILSYFGFIRKTS
jgi:glucan phosphoethanolaminetransferase (alkaline phosphatase superfamily)